MTVGETSGANEAPATAALGEAARLRQAPWRVAAAYACFGVLWILVSDRLASVFVAASPAAELVQTLKGLLYVGLTTVLVWALARRVVGDAERLQAAAELDRLQALNQSLLATMVEGFQIIGHDWRYRYVNDAVLAQARRSRDQLLGRTMMEVYPGIEETELFAVLRDCQENRVARQMENEFVYPDGERRYFHLSIQPAPEGLFILSADVTELRASEGRYRSLFDHMLNGFAYCRMIFEADRPVDFVYLAVNDAFETQTGLRDVVGKRVSEVIPGIRESDPELFEIYGRVARTGEPTRFEVFLEALQMWFEIAVYRPEPDHFVAVFDVVTERKRTEAALRESEQRYRTLFEEATEGIALADAETGEILDCNRAFCELTGYRREELLGQPQRMLHPEEPTGEVTASFAAHRSERHGELLTERLLTRSGEIRTVQIKAEVLTIGGRRVMQGFFRDVTDRERAEAERSRLVTAIEQAAEGVLITDTKGLMQYVSPAYEAITGYRRDELLGQNPRLLKSGQHNAVFYRELWATLTAGRTWQGRLVNRRRDGSLYTAETVISPVRDAAGRIINYVGVTRDITRELAVEEQLRQASKMESIGQLAGGVAHDFNNLLTIITGYGGALLEELAADDPHRADLAEIVEAADRAASLTRQLLAFSRRQALQPEPLDLNVIVQRQGQMLRRLIGEAIDFRCELAEGLGLVLADPGQLEQVLMNLVLNARDAMPTGGRLTVTTANVDASPGDGELAAGEWVCLTVADTGCGMDEATRARAFEPFFTTKGVGQGTGLGLATVYGIVKQSGGVIDLTTEVGQGTTFRICFPRIATTPALTPLAARPVGRGAGEVILVVEDEPALRELLGAKLPALGYTTHLAANASEALEQIAAGLRPDLLLTDVVMPGASGPELARRLRADWPDLRVLFMSGYAGAAIDELEPEAPFVAKPFTLDELAARLAEVLAGCEPG